MRAILPVVLMLAACAVPPADEDGAPVLLTVISEAGSAVAPDEGLFAIYGIEGLATGLTAADLAALELHAIETDFPAGSAARLFEGPRLSAVLAATGAEGAGARLTASDGYQVELTAEQIGAYEPVLAIRADGEPLTVGALGPAILVWPRGTDPALDAMTDDQWPWAVFAVEAIEGLPDAP